MKWMIASDIHGSAKWCERMLAAFEAEGAQRLLLLGDLLYHGPRNDLPEAYAPKEVVAMLDGVAPRLLCVRGNCEAEVDQMVLAFPVMADYCAVWEGGRLIYATHGHLYGPENPPPLMPGDALLYGHTHIPRCLRRDGLTFANPGSVAIPKADSPHSCATLEGGVMTWMDLAGGGAFDRRALW